MVTSGRSAAMQYGPRYAANVRRAPHNATRYATRYSMPWDSSSAIRRAFSA
jgi:hypothetical protein